MNIFPFTMTMDHIEQSFNSFQTDHLKNEDAASGDSKRRLKTELLAEQTCRLLFGDSTNLLDDIFTHPLSIDYFNVYLSLPIFGQRALYQRGPGQFDFDPPSLSKYQTDGEAKEWLMHCRLNNYIDTDIYIESLLGLLLTKADDITESSWKSYKFLGSKEPITDEQSQIFSTVTDVRHFHQFLQSTSGIKYWNFFLDSMRLLRSRHSTQFNRIDISYLNFIYKYYSQKHEFSSLTVDLDNPSMPNSSTSDTVWFRMAINAMHQLRDYWLPRYLSQHPSRFPSKRKLRSIDPSSNRMETVMKSTSEDRTAASIDDPPQTKSVTKETKLVVHTLRNISYLDYNPHQYILIQPSEQHDFQDDFSGGDDMNETDNDRRTELEVASPSSSSRSIEDYASDDNLELFYRILVSDSLAGLPFSEYISQTIPKTDAISYQTCLHFITDAEIFLSIPCGKFKERILRQFISRYLNVTATEVFPSLIAGIMEEQRGNLIKELTIEENNHSPLLWNLLLNITKFLVPQFLNYIKFDRLRFLVRVSPTCSISADQIEENNLNVSLISADLRRLFPTINFETFRINRPNKEETGLGEIFSHGIEFLPPSKLINCGERQDDLHHSLIDNQYHTTEKLINTDEHCEFRPGERFPSLTETELEEELRRVCTKFQWKDIKTMLGKSFDIPITSLRPDHSIFIGKPSLTKKVRGSFGFNEDSKLNPIETFTLDIMNSAREIVEVDGFVTNLMNESRNLFRTKTSFDSTKTARNSSPLSPIFEEILLTESSTSTTTRSSRLIVDNINNNAQESDDSIRFIQTKFLSTIGSYFINPPTEPNTNDRITSKSILSSKFETATNNDHMNIIHSKQSWTTDCNRANFPYQSIKFSHKEASSEAKTLPLNKQISCSQTDDQQQLLAFIRNQIGNHQWPLEEYIGRKGQRAWRALKLAADISNLDEGLLLSYHDDFDWISTDENFGSFGERNYLIQRNFFRRLERQTRNKLTNYRISTDIK